MQVSLDLSAKRIGDLARSGVSIVELLGQSFQGIIDFYNSTEGGLEPRIMAALSGLSPCACVCGARPRFRSVSQVKSLQQGCVKGAPPC